MEALFVVEALAHSNNLQYFSERGEMIMGADTGRGQGFLFFLGDRGRGDFIYNHNN